MAFSIYFAELVAISILLFITPITIAFSRNWIRIGLPHFQSLPFSGHTPENSLDLSVKGQQGNLVKRIVRFGDFTRGSPSLTDSVCLEWKIFDEVGKLIHDSGDLDFSPSFSLREKQLIRGWNIAVRSMLVMETAIVDMSYEYYHGNCNFLPEIECGKPVRSLIKLVDLVHSVSTSNQPDISDFNYPAYHDLNSKEMRNLVTINSKRPGIRSDQMIAKTIDENERIHGWAEGFKWEESTSSIDLYVSIPEDIPSSRLKVSISQSNVDVQLGSVSILSRGLVGKVYAKCSEWAVEEDSVCNQGMGRLVHIILQKTSESKGIWGKLFSDN